MATSGFRFLASGFCCLNGSHKLQPNRVGASL